MQERTSKALKGIRVTRKYKPKFRRKCLQQGAMKLRVNEKV